MTPIRDFEKKIQKEIHPELHLEINTYGAPDVAGAYLGNYYLGVSLPSRGLFPGRREDYTDANGVVWRSVPEAEMMIRAKIVKLKADLKTDIYDE